MPDTDTEAKLRGIKLACGIDPSAALIPAIQAIQQERDRLKAQLRNLDMQIQDEGERANESGGVLNPALLNLGARP